MLSVLLLFVGLRWSGVSGRRLGTLAPNTDMDINLSMIAVTPGLQVSMKLVEVKPEIYEYLW